MSPCGAQLGIRDQTAQILHNSLVTAIDALIVTRMTTSESAGY